MIKTYLKFQNNLFVKNLLIIVAIGTLILNLVIRVNPSAFIKVLDVGEKGVIMHPILPTTLFTICDVYLLLMFIIIIFFSIGTDFENSMEEISLVSGGLKTNKFFLRKIASLLTLYFVLYVVSFANIYFLYLDKLRGIGRLVSFKEILLLSFSTNLFIISLSLFVLFISRNITVSVSLITAYYLVEESLWRSKVTGRKGILGHLYQYSDYIKDEIYSIRITYIIVAIILLFLSYKISQRKFDLRQKLKRRL